MTAVVLILLVWILPTGLRRDTCLAHHLRKDIHNIVCSMSPIEGRYPDVGSCWDKTGC